MWLASNLLTGLQFQNADMQRRTHHNGQFTALGVLHPAIFTGHRNIAANRKRLKSSTTFSKKDLVANKWVSQAEAARIRDVTPQAIGRLIKKGRFRTLSIGGRVLLDRRDVEQYKPKRTGRPPK